MSDTRYTLGGDEHLFAELSESMSLGAFFRGILITKELAARNLPGVTEICPANASYQIRFDPDVLDVADLQNTLEDISATVGESQGVLSTRVLEIPVLYDDPWTNETGQRFRDRHQDPNSTDLEYAARINGYPDVGSFVKAHSDTPWFVSMVGFVAGLPFMYQMVERAKQIQVPKYLKPRTDTPKLTVGYGGCFSCIYSVKGAGGYQMFGVTPVPIYDPEQRLDHLKDFMILFRPGDIVKFRPIDRAEYDDIVAAVERNDYTLVSAPVEFSLEHFEADPAGSATTILEALHAH
ncbi:urea carboxylase [Mycobacterium sp. BK558]|uniref:Kinase A inhibitor n=1 Tax=Mycolicibacterium chlorophenolicum TaxID=37916 RepID=A0A0J6W4P5_9MYCO|nr:carboxyltransferase domain-containing protein [Mycolicibacterium chlorophenolicum]KMO76587.1 Kinase A inhibitor [Mycolicibacterium chlorophenolicum]RZT17919.1 urea carboxylase [Mycobacterium sp. BK558]